MKRLMVFGAVLLLAACGPRPSAQVEKVEICTEVGDYGLLVDAATGNDQVLIYSDEDLISWGVSPMMAHFSWVPLLDDYSEGSPLSWIISQF